MSCPECCSRSNGSAARVIRSFCLVLSPNFMGVISREPRKTSSLMARMSAYAALSNVSIKKFVS
jgi:hypothetical protein